MQKRNPFVVFILLFVTFGIYGIVWCAKTAGEMKTKGAGDVPHWILLLIPIVSLYYLWKYGESVEKVTGGKTAGLVAFLLLVFIAPIGMLVLQSKYNEIA